MHFEIYKSIGGEWRWRLVAANNRIIANGGEGYKNRQDAESAIRLVRSSGGDDVPIRPAP